MAKPAELYADGRKLAEGYPNLEQHGVEYFTEAQVTPPVLEIMDCVNRLIDVSSSDNVLLIGCGPKPESMRRLLERRINVVGLEPIASYVQSAGEYLGDPARVRLGSAESLPFENESQRVVFLESVLEHVDSPEKALAEIFRVTAPGGVLYVATTNRYRFSLSGWNGEFNTPFYNWFPAVVKESYIYKHLHFDPRNANFTPRPAVHWFSFVELCRLGRAAGFAHFYSKLDLLAPEDPSAAKSRVRRLLLEKVRYNPWLRGLALLQYGSTIFMVKRPRAVDSLI